ncbi:MAG TPA: FmdB family zinc ribbon protein [Candidatus Limnocylindrales bacterium]|nr:FmdB family zinc ribbon protein [Candidatus Limnocylindrales bacterium]
MPIYDYTCAACGHLTEVIHGMREGGPRFCPSCGAEGTMRKGFAAPAVHFKGSGWAKKDRSATASPGRSRTSKPADDAGSSPGVGGSSGTDSASTSATAGTTAATSSADGGD